MPLYMVYRDASDHGQAVREFLRDFEHRTRAALTVVDPDSTEGLRLGSLYDIVEYPTIIATKEDGEMRNLWRGLPLPTIQEVSYYVI